ncbi:rRNA maturation RNase YbeY [Candidatus Shapirobacteria bacterium]|nr:rRNA maturation RNase YbeY [Candidatus Shapirobacteria bacterium]
MENIVLIKHNKNWGLGERMVEELAKKALIKKGLKKDVELSVIFVGRKKALDLNLKFRQKNYYPQVLGFPMDKVKSVDGLIHLGDIVICTQKLKYEVKFQKSTLDKVLFDWLVHGVENLLK